jgi:hypothetical protein
MIGKEPKRKEAVKIDQRCFSAWRKKKTKKQTNKWQSRLNHDELLDDLHERPQATWAGGGPPV